LPTGPFQFRGLESNQHQRVQSPMSYRLDDPGISKHFDTAAPPKVRGEGFEPSSPGSRPGSLPVSRSPRVPCGSRTHLSGLEDQHLCHSAKGTKAEGEGVEPSRLIARPFSGRLPSPIGLPFRSSCGGRNRTCNRLLNREPPYHWATPQTSPRWDSDPRFPVPKTGGLPGFPTS
jgi:hypothetical protein